MKRSGLKPPTLEQVLAFRNRPRKALARSRKQIPKRGAKAEREQPALDAFRIGVRDQAGGMCEGFIYGICHDWEHPGTMAHHIWPEDRDCGRHEARRGAWLCFMAHDWVHHEPKLAAKIGLMRPEIENERNPRG